MLDETAVEAHLRPQVEPVLSSLQAVLPGLPEVLVVGAACRDALHAGLGRAGAMPATRDLDLGVAVPSLDAYERLVGALTRRRQARSGIQYHVGGAVVDLMPFGEGVEDAQGDVSPLSRRGEPFSVFGFREVYRTALRLRSSDGTTFRCPHLPGYVALKLKAWVDRHVWGEYKDGRDLALALSWYQEDEDVVERLYDEAVDLLVAADHDPVEAATRLLVRDVLAVLGPARASELRRQWGGVDDSVLESALTTSPGRHLRGDAVRALREGLGARP